MCDSLHRRQGPAGAVLGIDSNIFLLRKEREESERLFREAEARSGHQGGADLGGARHPKES